MHVDVSYWLRRKILLGGVTTVINAVIAATLGEAAVITSRDSFTLPPKARGKIFVSCVLAYHVDAMLKALDVFSFLSTASALIGKRGIYLYEVPTSCNLSSRIGHRTNLVPFPCETY